MEILNRPEDEPLPKHAEVAMNESSETEFRRRLTPENLSTDEAAMLIDTVNQLCRFIAKM